jgi:ferredoxin-NADP reductase
VNSGTGEPVFDLVVTRRSPVADGVVALDLCRPDGADLPAWQPGAHVDVRLPTPEGELIRQFSLCSPPEDRARWRIAVLREPAGRGGSRYVHDVLAEGDTLHVRGPRNHFPLEPADAYLFVAGGIGVTPLLPMVAEAERRGAHWRLEYGGRTADSMAFRAELVGRYGSRVRPRPEDRYGLLDLDDLLGVPAAGTLVYCCGPEPLLRAVEERCAGWPQGALHVERFASAPQQSVDAGAAGAHTFEVELTLSGQTLTVPPELSVLEAVEKAGVTALSSCRAGTCGTCETTVLAGEVEHRDALLTAEERARDDTMMICVSRAKGPRLVLEL